MKHLSKFMVGALALGLWSCSSDEPMNGGNAEETQGDFHATLTLQLPTTRSTTEDPDEDPAASDAGVEVGQTYENNVDDVLVVLATTTDEKAFSYVTYGYSRSSVLKDEAMPTYALQFENKDLADQAGNTLYVFAYCNPSNDLVNYFKSSVAANSTSWTDDIAKITNANNASIWADNSFLMTNAKLSSVTINETKEQLLANHNTPAKAFNLGEVTVERVAARFDFLGKAATTEDGIALAANEYIIKDNRNEANVAKVEFLSMGLFNEAEEFYYLPRVSANGLNENITLCGQETMTNWVVSPNATLKLQNEAYNNINYFYQLDALTSYEGVNGLAWTAISSLTNSDNNNSWNNGGTYGDYKIWRYATENTIPAAATNAGANQKQGTTTGVMFKAQLKALDNPTSEQGKVIQDAMKDHNVIYALDGVMYGDLESMKDYFAKQPVGKFADACAAAGLVANNFAANPTMAAAVAAGFAVYAPATDSNYYMYYPYFNKHNNNGNNNGMGVMEYQTVRNNVYKLAVTKVMNFGHPDKPGDPDQPGDDKPDETPEVLFRVSVKVLPWVVRINDIEF